MSFPQELQLKKQSNRIGWILTFMFGILFISSFLLYGIERFLLQSAGEKVQIFVSAATESVFYMSAFLIPSILFYALPQKVSCRPIEFTFRITRNFPLVLLAFLSINLSLCAVNDLFCENIGMAEQMEPFPATMRDPEIIALYITTALAPAFAEEILFRGVIYTNLRAFGKNIAILGSAVLFGLMHMNTAQFLYTTAAGILLAVLYEITGSVWSGILIHLCNNLYSILQTVISVRLPSAKGLAFSYMLQAILILVGVISIVILWCLYKRNCHQKQEAFLRAPRGLFKKRLSISSWPNEVSLPLGRSLYLLFTAPGMLVFVILAAMYMII